MLQKLLLLALAILIAVPSVNADRRKYVWTYQTTTLAPNASEIEFYQTAIQNYGENDEWEYRIEVEQGITPRFDLGVYQIFSQEEGSSFKWSAFQFRGRYRFALAGEMSFDPVLYIEYRRKLDDGNSRNKFELKLLLGKNFEKVNLSVNPVFEALWAEGFKPHQEIGLDAAISYSPSFKLALGVESTSRQVNNTDINKEDKFESAFGPTISYASGDTFYTVGVAWGLTDESNDVKFRFLMGIGL